MNLLKSFEIIKNELDNIADECTITIDNSPQYADAVTSIDKLCKILMRNAFAKKELKREPK